MKIKKIIGLWLSLIIIALSWNLCFAEDSEKSDIFVSTSKDMPQTGVDGFIIPLQESLPKIGSNGFIAEISKPDSNAVIITTPEELANIKSGSYVIGNDIDLSTYNGGIWVPIVPLGQIILDGQGHKITNLSNGDGLESFGLFGTVGGNNNIVVKNIGVSFKDNIDISETYFGSLIGKCDSTASIYNSFVVGSLSSNYTEGLSYVGGLVGFATKIDVKNCFSNCNMYIENVKTGCSGGLIGNCPEAIIENSYNNGNIFSNGGEYTVHENGGLVGLGNDITIINSYNVGDISCSGNGSTICYNGGIIGKSGEIIIKNCYNDGMVSITATHGVNYNGGLVGYSAPNIKINNSYNSGYIQFISQEVYGDRYVFNGGLIGSIGREAHPYKNKGISSVIEDSYNSGNIKNTIKNIRTLDSNTGGLIGYSSCPTNNLRNCFNSGNIESVDSKNSNKNYVGGILGYTLCDASIDNCYTAGNFEMSKNSTLGSISGYAKSLMFLNFNYFTNINKICGNEDAEISYSDGAFCIKIGNLSGEDGSNLEFTQPKYELEMGESYIYHLNLEISPTTDDISDISFESSNPDVAEISKFERGVGSNDFTSVWCDLNLKKVGTTIITAKNSKGASANCIVSVSQPSLKVESIDVNNQGKRVCLDTSEAQSNSVIKVKFNKEIDVDNEGNACLYYYYNDKKYQIGNTVKIEKIDSNTVRIIPDLTAIIPNGKICIDFSENSIKPVASYVGYNGVEDINGEYFVNTANFIVGLDTFLFKNVREHFYDDSETSISSKFGYSLSDTNISKLIKNGLSPNKIISKLTFGSWGGACYGISNYVAMVKRGDISFDKYMKELYIDKQSYLSNYLASSKMPKHSTEDNGLRDTLHYLFALQYTSCLGSIVGDGFFESKESSEVKVANKLKEIVDIIGNDKINELPITINVAYFEKGNDASSIFSKVHKHSILPYRIDKLDTGYNIYCYDSMWMYNPTVISFDNNYKNVKIYSTDTTGNTYGDLKGIGFDYVKDVETLYNNANSSTKLMSFESNDNVYISVVLNNNFEISNGNETIYYRDGAFSGATDLITNYRLYGGGDAESAAEIELELPKGNYSIKSSTNEILSCSYDSSEMFVAVNTSDKAEVSFNENKSINILGDNVASEIFLSLDESGTNTILVDIPKTDEAEINATNSNSINIKTDTSEKIEVTKITDYEETDKKDVLSDSNVDFSNEIIIIDSDNQDLSDIQFGDVDCNGKLTATDAAYIFNKVMNNDFVLPIEEITNDYMQYADVSGDKLLTVYDAELILEKVRNKDYKFPVEA